jgi:hypothetical protein
MLFLQMKNVEIIDLVMEKIFWELKYFTLYKPTKRIWYYK